MEYGILAPAKQEAQTMEQIEWITTQEAADRLGVLPARIRQILWEQRKGLTPEILIARKWGRDWQVDAASVERAKAHYGKLDNALDER